MKRNLLFFAALILCMVACQKDNKVFRLEVESYNTTSKMHLDNEHYTVWDHGDAVKINGETQTVNVSNNSATISVENTSANYYAVYPASIVNGTASSSTVVNLPAIQTYREDSYGRQILEAPMVAASEGGNALKFHNLGSLLVLTISNNNNNVYYDYPDYDMYVHRIEVIADPEDALCGLATISDMTTDNPALNITSGSNIVTLQCNRALVSNNQSRTFMVSMPPIESTHLTIKIYDDSYCYTLSQHNSTSSFGRSTALLVRFDTHNPVSVKEQYAPLSTQIWYTTSDNSPVLYNETMPGDYLIGSYNTHFGCYIVDYPFIMGDTWELLEMNAYSNCGNLVSITLPPAMETIESFAFWFAWQLVSVNLSFNLSEIHDCAFGYCQSLVSIDLPKSISYIGSWAFEGCESLCNVYCHRTRPPELDELNPFEGINGQCVLHVPKGCSTNYSNWLSYFGGGIIADL